MAEGKGFPAIERKGGAMKIREIMRTNVATVKPGSSVKEAFEIMRQGHFRHLPVVDKAGKVQGILSDRDIRNVTVILDRDVQGPEDYLIPDRAKVTDVMVPVPVTASPDEDVLWAVELMQKHGFSCLPVLDREKLVGIVTVSDLLKLLGKLLRQLSAAGEE